MSPIWQVAVLALWAFVIVLAVLVVGVVRRTADVLEQLEMTDGQPPLGAAPMSSIPAFELRHADGTSVSSAELFAAPATLLLFAEPTCAPCRTLMNQLSGAGEELEGIPFHVIVSDSEAARNGFASGLSLLFQRGEATAAFSNRATPQAYAIGQNGFVLDRRLPASADQLREMARFQRTGGGEGFEISALRRSGRRHAVNEGSRA